MAKKFASYFWNNKHLLVCMFLLILIASMFAQLTPYVQGLIVDTAVLDQGQQMLFTLCFVFFVIYLLDFICKFFLSVATTGMAFKITKDIRRDIFANIVYKPYDFFQKNDVGDVVYRTNIYIYEIGRSLSIELINVFYGISRFIIILVFIVSLNFEIGLCFMAFYLLVVLVIYFFEKSLVKKAKLFKQGELKRNANILENLEGLETFLAYNTKFEYLRSYKRISSKYSADRSKYYNVFYIFMPLMDFIVCLGTVLVYALVFHFSLGVLEIGIVVSVLTYASRILSPMQLVANGLANLFETSATVNEVFQYSKSGKGEEYVNQKFKTVDIKCENVCYENQDNNTNIQNLNLEIKFKEKILLYGDYGIGKTAFTYLLTSMYTVQKGKITYNDVNIKNLTTKSIGDIVGLTSDFVGIFNGTIRQNIKFVKPNASEKELKKAIKLSGLSKLINKHAKGIETKVTNETLSEADKQLISFARVILKNPLVVIVDEHTRDLDDKAKIAFHKNLEKFVKDKTLIYLSENIDVNYPFTRKISFKSIVK